MSLKAKIKPLIFFLGFVLAFNFVLPVYAYDYNPNTYPVTFDGLEYVNGTLTFSYYLSSTNVNYNHIAFRDTGQVFDYRDLGVTTFSFSSPVCETTLTTIGTNNYYLVGTNPVNCVIKTMYVTYLNNVYKGHAINNNNGITKTDIDNYLGSNFLENTLRLQTTYNSNDYFSMYNILVNLDNGGEPFSLATINLLSTPQDYFPFPLTPVIIDGTCGVANGTELTTIPPEASDACATGNFINFDIGYNELGSELNYVWLCEGINGGTSDACASAYVTTAVNGTCGTADGTSMSTTPTEYERCSVGNSNGTLLRTLEGWTWNCYGFNNGTTDSCSATYTEAETPPAIPDLTDCDTFTGIEKIVCNIGNTIQGIFLPSASKLTELQTTIHEINNVFPFNYLQVISGIFTNASNITEQPLTLTLWGNTETINPAFFTLPIFTVIKQGFTILIILMFIFWAIAYIKHFFK